MRESVVEHILRDALLRYVNSRTTEGVKKNLRRKTQGERDCAYGLLRGLEEENFTKVQKSIEHLNERQCRAVLHIFKYATPDFMVVPCRLDKDLRDNGGAIRYILTKYIRSENDEGILLFLHKLDNGGMSYNQKKYLYGVMSREYLRSVNAGAWESIAAITRLLCKKLRFVCEQDNIAAPSIFLV